MDKDFINHEVPVYVDASSISIFPSGKIECNMYSANEVAKELKIAKSRFPLLASLVGTEFTQEFLRAHNFYAELSKIADGACEEKNKPIQRIQFLVDTLSNLKQDEEEKVLSYFVDKFMHALSEQDKTLALQTLKSGIRSFKMSEGKVWKFKGFPVDLSQTLPASTVHGFRRYRMFDEIISHFCHQNDMALVFPGDTSPPNAFIVSEKVRQLIFGICLHGNLRPVNEYWQKFGDYGEISLLPFR